MPNLLFIATLALLYAAALLLEDRHNLKMDLKDLREERKLTKFSLENQRTLKESFRTSLNETRNKLDEADSKNEVLMDSNEILSQVSDALLDELDDAHADYIKLDREHRSTKTMLEATNKENGRLDAEILSLRDEVSLNQERDKNLIALSEDANLLELALNAIADSNDKNFKRFAKKTAIDALRVLYYGDEEEL